MSVDAKKVAPGHKLSDFKVQVARLATQGNKPEEWKEYIDSLKSRVHLLEESKQKAMFEIIYPTAFKAIPDTSKTLAYASLLVDYADFKSKYDMAEADKLLFYCRWTLGNFAIVHVASAELELKRGNKDKAVRILQKAKRSCLEQGEIISVALQRVHEGRIPLLGDYIKEDRTESDTSPTSGKEMSEDLNMSQFSGYIGESNTASRQPLASLLKIPETPDVKQPSPAKKKSLHHFHSTPVLGAHTSGIGSSMKKSLRKFHPRNPLPPPRRVKVDPASKSLWDDDEDNKSDISVSDFPLLEKDFKMHSYTGESKTSESSEIHTEPQEVQEIRSVLNNQLSGHSLFSKQDSNSQDLNSHQQNFLKKADLSSYKINSSQEIKLHMGRQRHISITDNLKERLEGGGDTRNAINASSSLYSLQGVQKLAASQKTHSPDGVLLESHVPSSMASYSGSSGKPKSFEIRQKLSQEQKDHNPYLKQDIISQDSLANKQNILDKTGASPNKLNYTHEKLGHVSTLESLKENLEGFGDASRKNKYNTSSAGVPSHGSQPAASVQKFAANQKAQPQNIVPAESSISSSVPSYSEGSNVCGSGHAQSIELKQKLFQEQQELVKQQVLEQQQQMKQPAAGNPTYSVLSQNPNPAQVAYVTPAKQTFGTGQKTLYVNGLPYTVIRMVGRGGSAKVYQVFDPSANKICALKVVNLSCANAVVLEGFKNEIALLKKLQHCDRVIKLFDSEYRESSQKLFLVLEFGEIDLDKFIAQNVTNDRQLSPSTIFYFWLQMVTAVHAMHKEGVIHSDLKPPNFILVAGVVKLIDFGIANSIQQDSTSVLKDIKMGTPSYMSPEMLVANTTGPMDNKPRYKVGKRSDVWSLGCILYQMVYGRTPFQNVPDKINAIINPNHPIDFPHRDDAALMDVLKVLS
ncbi:ttk protein kinase [Elysia marginata]|uniref:Ttk protein kinase n=1 Tax=Elysia marginata TaxID=1093978 RepID=A0AAV4EQZ8_9GAST|nr:ttk protein kinase [Elysia marginata]